MEIASLKRINSSLNKKINEFKKKSSKGIQNNINNNNYIQNETSSSQDINRLNEKLQNISDQNKDLSEQIHKISFEKQQLEISNNDKDDQIKRMQNIIDDLNIKINDYQSNINNINNENNKEKDIDKSKSLTLTEKSIDNEIVNFNSKEIKENNLKKENEDLNKKYKSLKSEYDELQIEVSIYKKEFESLKKAMEEKKNINKEKYTPDKYNILCDKNYEQLQWFLLIPKDIKFNNDYNNLIWVEKSSLDNIDKFNKFESEIETQNNTIINYVKKLEQKEEIINKLNYKINSFDKNINTNLSNDINNINNYNYNSSHNYDSGISLEKYNILLNRLNDTEEKLKILQIENKKLKDKMHHKKRNSVKKIEENTEGSNNLGYNKNYVLHLKEEGENKIEKENTITNNIESNEDNDNENESEDYSETDTEISELKNELETARIELNQLSNECKNLENKIKILREASSNLLIKMNIPNKYKEEIKTILKLFEFTDSEIVFIVDKKKQY